MTEDDLKLMQDRIAGKKQEKKVKNKYKAKKTDYRGRVYDSKKEANYAKSLDLMMQSDYPDKPLDWTPQVRMPVKINDKHICYYILDFKVEYKDRTEYIDVKGYKKGCAYQMFRLKKKMIEAYYDIEIIEI